MNCENNENNESNENYKNNKNGMITNHTNFIKKYIENYIQNEYKKYLSNNKILLINENKLYNILLDFHDKNIKLLKSDIKIEIKNEILNNKNIYKIDNLSLDNLIFEIFSDKDKNISLLKEKIVKLQDFNLKKIKLPIINNSLNLNISIYENFIKINKVNIKNIEEHNEIYDLISKYEFIYSINNIILETIENNKKIETIKSLILNKDIIDVELYYLKKNKENYEKIDD